MQLQRITHLSLHAVVRPRALGRSPLAFAFILALAATGPGLAQSRGTAAAVADEQRPPIWTSSSGIAYTLFPAGDVFPVYVADPHRPTNAIVPHFYLRQSLTDASSPRAWLSAGGRFGILRIGTGAPGGRAWQVGIEAGLDALFDSQHKSENLGWDGNYGLTLTTAAGSPWAFKIAILHVSAHLGDEHAERTGRARLNYTREEVAVGAAYGLGPRWRVYGELAGAYIRSGVGQEPWRLQAGLEYEAAPRLWGGRFAWYAAGDFASWEERRWRLDSTLQVGIVTRSNGHTYRLLIEYLDGRPPLGEFFRDEEASLGLGLRIDF